MSGNPREPVIVSGARIPTGRFQGGLATMRAPDLGAIVVREVVKRAGVTDDQIDEVIMGNVLQAGVGQNPARQAALKAGLPDTIAAMTLNKVCGSGLKSAMIAASEIMAGQADLIVAGGMESMSRTPYMLDRARDGYRLGHGQLTDLMVHDGLWDVYNDYHMGIAAEFIADKFGVSREAQDEYAVNSHKKAVAAMKAGKFDAEIVPVEVPQRKGDPVIVAKDEGPREDTTLETLGRLRPAFKKDGKVTAGNAPSVNDGAAAVLVASREKAQALGLKPMARILGYTTAGTAPEMLFYAPVVAVRKLMDKLSMDVNEFDLYEFNEAFSAQMLVDGQELGVDWNKVNVNGGAVALGHPIGASGARVLVTLLYALKDRGGRKGLASLCLGGGNAVAMAVEMEETS
jgi:acetyl-CoA C-acetyltransferase